MNVYVLFDGVVNEPYVLSGIIYLLIGTSVTFIPIISDLKINIVLYTIITILVSLIGFIIWCKMKKTKYHLKDLNINIANELTV